MSRNIPAIGVTLRQSSEHTETGQNIHLNKVRIKLPASNPRAEFLLLNQWENEGSSSNTTLYICI